MNQSRGFNPTPISKLIVTLILSFSLTAVIHEIASVFVVAFISLFFALNNRAKTAIKTLVFYGITTFIVYNANKVDAVFIKNYVMVLLLFVKMFFLPFLAGKFFIETSDVSSMIVSFEWLRCPRVVVLPIAVMFRYFPAFKDDKKNIGMAMKMRGISFANPIKYLEYVSIPLLISAINIADDISKAAETKCIADPCKKVRYKRVRFGLPDIVYLLGIIICNILGRMYA